MLQRLGKRGILIVRIEPDGPASQAGFQPTLRDRQGNIILGDIILAINDKQVDEMNELSIALERYKPGDTVKVTLDRHDQIVETDLVLGQAR